MKKFNLKDFKRGWLYGDFAPSLHYSEDTEIAIKRYNKDDHEERHFHKIATEWTIIVEGAVEMNGVMYYKDDIIKIEPNESTDFKCLTDVTTVVIKSPCVKDDKYVIYNINVGELKDEDTKDYIKKIQESFKKNPATGEIRNFKLPDSDITYYNNEDNGK